MIQVDYSSHLTHSEKRAILMWYLNERLSIWNPDPSVDTCQSRIARVGKQCVYNTITDFLAWGYIRERQSNLGRCPKAGRMLPEDWMQLERIVLDKPWLYVDEMRDELNSTCDTNYKIDVIKKALLTHRYTWKKIERITREQDHMLRREYHETIKHIKS